MFASTKAGCCYFVNMRALLVSLVTLGPNSSARVFWRIQLDGVFFDLHEDNGWFTSTDLELYRSIFSGAPLQGALGRQHINLAVTAVLVCKYDTFHYCMDTFLQQADHQKPGTVPISPTG